MVVRDRVLLSGHSSQIRALLQPKSCQYYIQSITRVCVYKHHFTWLIRAIICTCIRSLITSRHNITSLNSNPSYSKQLAICYFWKMRCWKLFNYLLPATNLTLLATILTELLQQLLAAANSGEIDVISAVTHKKYITQSSWATQLTQLD